MLLTAGVASVRNDRSYGEDRSGDRYAVLLTGASGYIGKLIAAALLLRSRVDLVLPVRPKHDPASLLADIEEEVAAAGGTPGPELAARLRFASLPPFDRLDALDSVVREAGVEEIVHCAGCLDYFDRQALELVNVEFTRRLLERGRHWQVRRFVYISTAFSGGYVEGPLPETLHREPPRDPTEYTRTKRAAERLVAESGLPFLCVRPAIVIGDSRDGRYAGKQYGLYQLWSGIERLLCSQWEPDFHVVARQRPICLVHQDAFQSAFLAAWRGLPPGSFLNLVSAPEVAPDCRDLWNFWMEECFRPRSVRYYEHVSDLPVRDMPRRQRALMALASVNLEIGNYGWRFETANLRRLRDAGLDFADATRDSVLRCQRSFMRASPRIQAFLRELRPDPSSGAVAGDARVGSLHG